MKEKRDNLKYICVSDIFLTTKEFLKYPHSEYLQILVNLILYSSFSRPLFLKDYYVRFVILAHALTK